MKRIATHCSLIALGISLLLTPARAQEPAAQEASTAHFALFADSLQDVLSEAKAVEQTWGLPLNPLASMREAANFIGTPNLEGIALNRPLFVMAHFADSGEPNDPVIVLPLADVEAFRTAVEANLEELHEADGITTYRNMARENISIRILNDRFAMLSEDPRHQQGIRPPRLPKGMLERMPGSLCVYVDGPKMAALARTGAVQQKEREAEMERMFAEQFGEEPPPADLEVSQAEEQLIELLFGQLDYLLMGVELDDSPAINYLAKPTPGTDLAQWNATPAECSALLRSLPPVDAPLSQFGNTTGMHSFTTPFAQTFMQLVIEEAEGDEDMPPEAVALIQKVTQLLEKMEGGSYASYLAQPSADRPINYVAVMENSGLVFAEMLDVINETIQTQAEKEGKPTPTFEATRETGHRDHTIRHWAISVDDPDKLDDEERANMEEFQRHAPMYSAEVNGYTVFGVGDLENVQEAIDHLLDGETDAPAIADAPGPVCDYNRINVSALLDMLRSLDQLFNDGNGIPELPPIQGNIETLLATTEDGIQFSLRIDADLANTLKRFVEGMQGGGNAF